MKYQNSQLKPTGMGMVKKNLGQENFKISGHLSGYKTTQTC